MARFPKIDSPCPLKANFRDAMVGDICSMCDRKVHDIGAMTDDARADFMSGCEGEVCVTYTLPLKRTVATALAAASLMAMPAAAQEAVSGPCHDGETAEAHNAHGYDESDMGYDVVIVGGISDTKLADYVDTEQDLEIPEMPVIYEDDEAEPATEVPVVRDEA